MSTTTIIVIAVIVVIALAFLFLVRGRKQHVSLSDTPPLTRTAAPAPKAELAPKVDLAPEVVPLPEVAPVAEIAPAPEVAPVAEPAPEPKVAPAPKSVAAPPPPPAVPAEGHGITTEIADAVEDVVDQFIGINSHVRVQPTKGPGDTLTQLKGLGPKAASILADLGVTRFEQIALWDDADVAAIDAQMGAFKGRIVKDRWVDQARLLAKGDIVTFETEFGALGS